MRPFYTLIITFILIFTSCTYNRSVVTWEKSNASLIKKSINDLNVSESISKFIDKNEYLIVVGAEDEITTDYSLLATIEDGIIKELVNNNYQILERDNDLLFRLFSEQNDNFKYINKNKETENSFSYSQKSSEIASLNNFYGSSLVGATSGTEKKVNYDQYLDTRLSTADKILSYRVIESGVVYNYNDKSLKSDEVKREARTILEAKLIDAKTSKVITAFTLDGNASDNIYSYDIDKHKDFSYKYYSHTLPKKYGNPSKSSVVEGNNKKNPTGAYILGASLFTILLVLIL